MHDDNRLKEKKKYIAIILIVLFGIIVYSLIDKKAYIKVISVFQPIIIGAVVAYLLNPLVKLFDRMFHRLFAKIKKPEKHHSLCRGLSITLAILILLAVISLILYLIIPQISGSVTDFINDTPKKVDALSKWYDSFSTEHDFIGVFGGFNDWLKENFGNSAEISFETLFVWIKDNLFHFSGVLGNEIIAFFGTTFSVAFNIIIGLVAAIYLLSSKEKIFAHIKKVLYAFFDKEKVNDFIGTSREGNVIVTRFIVGKLIDSLIVGILCFIVLLIFNIPYPVLVSVIVAVTDIIPFFGPYIGAVPCTLLILLADPIKALYFVIIIIAVQQVEGNLISPKIIGDTIGLSPFWVLFAMIIGGGLFGLAGMLAGVPVLAIIFFVVNKAAVRRLEAKNMPTSSAAYMGTAVPELAEEPDAAGIDDDLNEDTQIDP